MTSKTHIAAGIAITTALIQPNSIKALAICITTATIGSIISDIDVTTSESHKDLIKILTISIIMIILCSIADGAFHIGIIAFILKQTNLCRILIGILAFLLVCSFGMHKPHRTFMHSIPCVLTLSAIVFLILPSATFSFGISMLSHIILDLFNKKKVQIFYPWDFKFALKFCTANGTASNLICSICTALCFIEIGIFISNYHL